MLVWLLALISADPVLQASAAQKPPTIAAQPPVAAPRAAPVAPRRAEIGYMTAGELATRCEDNSSAAVSYCFAYIAAIHDTVRAYELWLRLREFCLPDGTPQSDLRRAFVAYLQSNPGDRGGQAASVVVVSLKKRYPCADKN